MSGWVAVGRDESRRLMDSFPGRIRRNARSVWLEVLLRAQYLDGQYDGKPIRRGQFPFGQDELARTCGITRKELITVLNRFAKSSVLHIETNNLGSMATVMNFNTYSPLLRKADRERGSKCTAEAHQADIQNKNKYKDTKRILRT